MLKLLVTTCKNPSVTTVQTAKELVTIFYNSSYFKRGALKISNLFRIASLYNIQYLFIIHQNAGYPSNKKKIDSIIFYRYNDNLILVLKIRKLVLRKSININGLKYFNVYPSTIVVNSGEKPSVFAKYIIELFYSANPNKGNALLLVLVKLLTLNIRIYKIYSGNYLRKYEYKEVKRNILDRTKIKIRTQENFI
uniref:U3 snoRNP protein IMP4 n=1 Tax=Amorphochlora amoebiformis TaxID=1561963 RepID=A0A0H5BQY3_9EUKA|nr:U3 snoRNP protein IMP4 [Amorphochlora amoebiformis]